MKFNSNSMREGPIFKSVIIYTVPIILTSILQLLFNAADLIVVGWFSGSDSVAAVGATGSLTNLIVNLFIGLSVGAGYRCRRRQSYVQRGAYCNSYSRGRRLAAHSDRRGFFGYIS